MHPMIMEKEKIEHDPVNHPSHYETGKYQCIDVMEEVFGIEDVKAFCLCNAFKYLYRAKHKVNMEEDLRKCVWYVNKWVELNRRENHV